MPGFYPKIRDACVLMMAEKASDLIRFGTRPADVAGKQGRSGLFLEAISV